MVDVLPEIVAVELIESEDVELAYGPALVGCCTLYSLQLCSYAFNRTVTSQKINYIPQNLESDNIPLSVYVFLMFLCQM